ncbi:PEPxxWA-CTERM sorting domain-containing protein [Sphingomonas sp. KR1UV-12]|uniref:PEPxxWA-CTERM sorting domain-containing protein n=1 Tax=Sphingomonas aurea TaxID=3063994 RepID=A0ABT9EN53_9SPHN|nr:PEPxxWA-CTERM sorting domain-containing protein [Sphingomonas sp. KR1UV-12]MDP1028390.1 PEPxxWA-CTERM sorting domain-containing protein [Sphingomonas sp. KR1UV-12]
MKKILGALVAAVMTMAPQVASAVTTFSFSFSGVSAGGGAFNASGFLFADDGVPSDGNSTLFTLTGAKGTLNLPTAGTSLAITGVGTLTNDAGVPQNVNQIVSLGDQSLLAQVAFTFADPDNVALFTLTQMGYIADAIIAGNQESAENVQFDVAAVPEPATWAMMVLGFAAVGATMRRRRVAVSFAA